MLRTSLLLAAFSPILAAQSVGTSFRSLTLAPEEIVVDLLVSTPTETLPEQTVSYLALLRVTPQDLRTVGTIKDAPERLGWQYSITRPYSGLLDLVKQLAVMRQQLRELNIEMSYQFFFRASPQSVDAAKRKVLAEMLTEAKRSAGGSGKLRSVTIEPTPESVDALRSSKLFSQSSGALQYHFSLVAVFDNE